MIDPMEQAQAAKLTVADTLDKAAALYGMMVSMSDDTNLKYALGQWATSLEDIANRIRRGDMSEDAVLVAAIVAIGFTEGLEGVLRATMAIVKKTEEVRESERRFGGQLDEIMKGLG